MKSIRRSLIVYVLVLLTVALGAVSWFAYGTTARSLRERQSDSEKLINGQFESKERAVRADLDDRIREQARTMARTARSVTVHTDGQAIPGFII